MTWATLTPQEKRAAVRELVETNSRTYLQAATALKVTPNIIAGVIDRAKRARQPIKTTSGFEFSGKRGRVPKVKKVKAPPTPVNANAIARKRQTAKKKHAGLTAYVALPAVTVAPVAADPSAWTALPGSHPVEITAHTGGCRWPIDRAAPLAALFCDLPVHEAGVYCQAHAKLAFREPVVAKRKETAWASPTI